MLPLRRLMKRESAALSTLGESISASPSALTEPRTATSAFSRIFTPPPPAVASPPMPVACAAPSPLRDGPPASVALLPLGRLLVGGLLLLLLGLLLLGRLVRHEQLGEAVGDLLHRRLLGRQVAAGDGGDCAAVHQQADEQHGGEGGVGAVPERAR